MLKLFLICFSIIPVFWGNNEIFLTNLSITAIGAVIIGYIIIIIFFNGSLISRNYQHFLNIFRFIIFSVYLFFLVFMFLKKIIKHSSEIKWILNKNYSTTVDYNNPRDLIEIHPHFFDLGKIDGKYVLLKGFFTHKPCSANFEWITKDFKSKLVALQLDKVDYEIIENKVQVQSIVKEIIDNYSDRFVTVYRKDLAKDLGEVLQVYFFENKNLQLTDVSKVYETCAEFVHRLDTLEFLESNNNNNIINND